MVINRLQRPARELSVTFGRAIIIEHSAGSARRKHADGGLVRFTPGGGGLPFCVAAMLPEQIDLFAELAQVIGGCVCWPHLELSQGLIETVSRRLQPSRGFLDCKVGPGISSQNQGLLLLAQGANGFQ